MRVGASAADRRDPDVMPDLVEERETGAKVTDRSI